MNSSTDDQELIGTVLKDTYRVIEKLGEGGMAAVYLAEHVTIGKRCAVKVLYAEHAHREDLVERFLQEARAASAIEHENVVEITDFGAAPNGTVFFVMEHLSGEDLADTIAREKRLEWPRVRDIALQICEALAAAHARGIIHRDLKPENCFRISRRGTDDFIKVLDFGIAKVTQDVDGAVKGLTKTGSIFGSPEYMAPEQAAGVPVDHRADIYSLGCILYELVTGRTPFLSETYMGLLTMHMYEPPLPPSQAAPDAAIAPEAEAVILKAMAKAKENRFQNMQEFATAIANVGTGAASVVVVDENIKRPRGAALLMGIDADEPASGGVAALLRSRVGIAVAAVALVLLALALFRAFSGDDPPPKQPEPVAPPAPVVAPPPKQPEPPPPPPEVTVTVASEVDGEVFDDESDEPLGRTGEPIKLKRGDEARALRVEAEGYTPARVEVVPDDDAELEVELEKKKRTRGKKSTRKTKKKGAGKKDPLSLNNPWNKKKK